MSNVLKKLEGFRDTDAGQKTLQLINARVTGGLAHLAARAQMAPASAPISQAPKIN